jgi:hypothetical protein
VLDNVAWPYFDTYDIHSYSPVESYAKEFATSRVGACGRPIWISECGIHVHWNGEHGDLSDAEEERQARFVPQSYATSLYAGVSRHFFFILGNYCEGKVQFGLLRHDLTPRRGYLALAATGRLLADARPLASDDRDVRVYAFRCHARRVPRDVIGGCRARGGNPLPPCGARARRWPFSTTYGRVLPAVQCAWEWPVSL